MSKGHRMRFHIILGLLFSVMIPAITHAEDSAVDTFGAMYWTDRKAGIYRAARDGSEITLIVPRTIIDSIAIDREGGRLYWMLITNRGLQQVELWQGKLDGSGATLLAGGFNWTGDVVFDPVDKHLYVSSLGDAKIMRLNADGSDKKDFVVGIPKPSRLFLDAENRKLYWASNSRPRIDRVNLDGSAREAVLTNLPGVAFGFGIDPVEQKIYWTHPAGDLYRARLDGGDRQRLFAGLSHPDGLAIDIDNRKLYWVEVGKLSQSNLDGSNQETLVTGKSNLYASLEILPPAE